MIYIILSEKNSIERSEIIGFIKQHIKYGNFNYRIIYTKLHIVESDIYFIDREKDIVLWQPIVVFNNLEFVKNFLNSIVILKRQSVLLQKISKYNPVNENMAINHGFYVVYINPDEIDITNDEWKLVVKDEMYLLDNIKLMELISLDLSNIKTEQIKIENIYDKDVEFIDIIKNQINIE